MMGPVLAFGRLILGLMVLPLCVWVSKILLGLFELLAAQTGDGLVPFPLLAFGIGFVVWMLMYLFLPRPVRSYVLAHELTHAIWGLLMGARVSKLRIRQDGGSVTLSKSNIWITLAPYFFPFYTVLIVVLYYATSCFWDVSRWHLVWLGLIGFTWGFHCTFTISSLLQHQSDVQVYGYVLSYAVIYVMNALGVCIWIVSVSRLTLEQMVSQCVSDFAWTIELFGKAFHSMASWIMENVDRLQ